MVYGEKSRHRECSTRRRGGASTASSAIETAPLNFLLLAFIPIQIGCLMLLPAQLSANTFADGPIIIIGGNFSPENSNRTLLDPGDPAYSGEASLLLLQPAIAIAKLNEIHDKCAQAGSLFRSGARSLQLARGLLPRMGSANGGESDGAPNSGVAYPPERPSARGDLGDLLLTILGYILSAALSAIISSIISSKRSLKIFKFIKSPPFRIIGEIVAESDDRHSPDEICISGKIADYEASSGAMLFVSNADIAPDSFYPVADIVAEGSNTNGVRSWSCKFYKSCISLEQDKIIVIIARREVLSEQAMKAFDKKKFKDEKTAEINENEMFEHGTFEIRQSIQVKRT